jgi:hypothetical protein
MFSHGASIAHAQTPAAVPKPARNAGASAMVMSCQAEGVQCMRVLGAAVMIALLAAPAYAQSKTPGPPPPPPKSQQEIEADRAAERAYKSSLGNIPDQPAADPWGNARSLDAPKVVAKTPAAKPRTKTGSAAN